MKYAANIKTPKLACGNCGKKKSKLQCSGCEVVWYCSSRCQRSDRSNHKTKCGKGDIAGSLVERAMLDKSIVRYYCLHCHAIFTVDTKFPESMEMLKDGCSRCEVNFSFLKKMSAREFHQCKSSENNDEDAYSSYKSQDGTVKYYRLKGLGGIL